MLLKHLKTLLAIAAISIQCSVLAQGFSNPIISGFHPDPSVCRAGDDYYLVTSTFEYFPGVPIFHSKDLVNWTKIGHCLTRDSQLDLEGCRISGGIYAPTIRYNDGRFYMITTNLTGKGNFLVHTTDPAGEWSDPVWLEQGGIDPSLSWDDGKCYMVSNPNDEITLCQIDPLTGEQLTESIHIWDGTGGRFPEAPHIYKKDGFFYLVASEGGTQYGHKVTIARSRKIEGPYTSNPANPIMTHADNVTKRSPIQGLGHADFIEAQDGSWWVVALGFRPVVYRHHVMGRESFLAPVDWAKNGWPVVNGNGTVALEMDCETLPQTAAAEREVRDNFDTTKYDLEWNFIRNPHRENYSLSERNGFLRLHGTEVTLNELASPTFIGRRQDVTDARVETKMVIPANYRAAESGITAFMNPDHHYKMYVTEEGGKRKLTLSYNLGLIKGIEKSVPLSSREVYLRIESCPTHYAFSYSTDGKKYETMGEMDTRYLSSETAGGFTGLYYGLYSVATKKGQYVDFDWFDYEPKQMD